MKRCLGIAGRRGGILHGGLAEVVLDTAHVGLEVEAAAV